MLDQLPSEVILKISSLLTLKDKLILIRTCQQFFNLISKTNLYSKLNIFDHPRQEEEIIDKFINSRYPGSQVKKLYFNINSISDQLLFQLSTIFPNITSVRTSRYRTGDVMFQHRYTKGPMLQWSNTLQIFDLMYDWPEVLPILKTTTFPRLTDLRLSSPYDFDDKKEGFDVSYFLPVFKNVPSLKELTLGECALDLDLLEEIHASCPLIKSLFIRNAHIIIAKEYALPLTILPADSLLSLSINDVFCFDINGLLLEYITSKYRHLKKLDFQLQSGYDAYFFNKYHRHQVDDDGDDDLIAQEYIPFYSSLSDDLENSMDIYNKSQLSFFSNFPNTIKSITVESNIFTNIIQIIANLNIEPAKLNILGQIEDTSQIHYVKDISTLNTLELEIFDLNPIYTYNFESTSLTSLTISTYIGTTCIDWLLTTFPSLEELRITGSSECKVMNEIDTTKQFPNLWKFTAALSFISQKCVDFLILTAPNMRELDLRANKTPGFSNINIDISGWELRQLNLDVFEILDPVSLFCNVNIQNITKIIKCDPSEQSLAVVKNSSPFRLKKAGVVNIVSTREKQFMFNGFSISLSLDNITIDFKKQ